MNDNPNYGWKYYRDYYHNVDLKNKVHDFELKNKSFEESVISSVVSEEHGTHGFSLKSLPPGLLTDSGYPIEIGMAGEFKNSLFFDYTSGMPIIPGFLIKGVLRSVFPCNNEEDEQKEIFLWSILSRIRGVNSTIFEKKTKGNEALNGKQKMIIRQIELEIFEGRDFKNEPERSLIKREKYFGMYHRDVFFDAFPEKGSGNENILASDSNVPSGSGTVPLLKVSPDTILRFNFILNDGYYLTATQKQELFRQIIITVGLGAKTSMGYGHFDNNPDDAKPKEIPPEIFPEEIYDFLKKGTIFPGKITEIIGEYFVIIFEVEGEACQTRKNKANYSDLELGMEVLVECKNDFDIVKGSVQLGILK